MVGRLVAGACAVAAAAVVLSGCSLIPVPCKDFVFDRAAWKASMAASDSDDSRAQDIAGDLVRCHALTGMTRADIRHVLGRPVPEEAPPGSGEMWWAVGVVNNGMGPGDAQMLIVRFNDRGRVRSASLLYDE